MYLFIAAMFLPPSYCVCWIRFWISSDVLKESSWNWIRPSFENVTIPIRMSLNPIWTPDMWIIRVRGKGRLGMDYTLRYPTRFDKKILTLSQLPPSASLILPEESITNTMSAWSKQMGSVIQTTNYTKYSGVRCKNDLTCIACFHENKTQIVQDE